MAGSLLVFLAGKVSGGCTTTISGCPLRPLANKANCGIIYEVVWCTQLLSANKASNGGATTVAGGLLFPLVNEASGGGIPLMEECPVPPSASSSTTASSLC